MFLKASTLYKYSFILAAGVLLNGCSASISNSVSNRDSGEQYVSRYLVPNQLPVPQSIQSVQLYRKGSDNNPPIIELGSAQKMVLAFDELSDLSGQFRITFTHHDQDWDNSNIPQDWYLEGINEIIVGGGEKNELSDPDFFHYETEFPNNRLKFKISGNYMLHVSDYNSGVKLFSLPFFVTEDAGEIRSWVETIYNAGQRYNAVDQPFSEFVYPDFIEFPQFDLSFYFVQNRFWGDQKRSENYDFSEQDRSQFHLSRERAFPANYDFIGLNLNFLSVDGSQIIDVQFGQTPPLVILREDILNFTSDPVSSWTSNFGNPKSSTDSRYASVRFRFDDGGRFSEDKGVYLVGDFNQWLLSENNKLHYNEDSGYWETTSLIKQGTYTYKYATKEGEYGIDDLILSDTVTRRNQEYASFVYFQDPEYRYQRLLQVQIFRSSE